MPQALHAVLRAWIRALPLDQDLRLLRKQVIAKEPALHAINMGRTIEVESGLVAAIEERLTGEDAHDRAVVTGQLAFALTRSAFVLSMEHGTELADEFERALSLYAQDLLELELADGQEGMVPFVEQIVLQVDPESGRVVIDPPPGLLDLEAAQGTEDEAAERAAETGEPADLSGLELPGQEERP